MNKKMIIVLLITILLTDLIIVGAEPIRVDGTKDQNGVEDGYLDNFPPVQNGIFEDLTTNPDYFIENNGQLSDDSIKYYSPDGSTWFTADGAWIEIRENAEIRGQGSDARGQEDSTPTPQNPHTHTPIHKNKSIVLKQEFVGANLVQPSGKKPLETYSNFYHGSSQSNWRTGVRHYKEIYYENLYSGIDLRYYMVGSGLKYDFIVHPGSDPSQIRLKYFSCLRVDLLQYHLFCRQS